MIFIYTKFVSKYPHSGANFNNKNYAHKKEEGGGVWAWIIDLTSWHCLIFIDQHQ
jgi:hypothetical protein